MTFYPVRLHSIPGIKRKVITTNLDDYSGDAPSSPVSIPDPQVSMTFRDDMVLLYYREPVCPRCLSRHVSRNGVYARELSGRQVKVQRYICNDCSYSFEARPPGYGYGKHIPDDLRRKAVSARLKSSLRKAADMCMIYLGAGISHETVRQSVPGIPHEAGKMESSGYFSYDEQYVSVHGRRKYRFLLKDQHTLQFREEILDELGEDATLGFLLRSLSGFSIPGTITITTDGYHYRNALAHVSRSMRIGVKRQRCLFHILKDLTKKAHDAGKLKELRGALDLINYMFFQTPENLEKLGKNADPVARMISGMSVKDATFRILDLVRDLHSGDPIIGKFLVFIRKNRRQVFRYLEDENVQKTNNVSEHHFSMRSELLKKRFKTCEGLLKTSYWYHRFSTEI